MTARRTRAIPINRRAARQAPLAATVLVLLALLMHPAGVLAHAELVGSEPADGSVTEQAPQRVRLHFSEPIEPDFFALEVYASDRARVDAGNARIAPDDPRVLEVDLRPLANGTYTVVWRALSLDSHVVRGTFAFGVGSGTTPAPALDLGLTAAGAPFLLEAAVRWFTFLTAFVLLGAFTFPLLILAAALRQSGLTMETLEPGYSRALRLTAWLALAGLLVASFIALVLQAASAAGVPLDQVFAGHAVTRVLTATRYGVLWLLRVVVLISIAGVLAWLSLSPTPGRGPLWVGAVLAALALLTFSAAGHASALPEATPLAILADWIHLLAGAVWIGGLVQFALVLGRCRTLEATVRRRLLGALVPRFSRVALVSVALVIATGLRATLQYIPSADALLDTPYGAALSGKLILVGMLLAFAAVNLLALRPRLSRGSPAPRGAERERRLFTGMVLAEILLAVLVLASTGILTGLAPASTEAPARPFSETRQTPSYAVTFAVTPNQAGENRLSVSISDARGVPAAQVRAVHLTLTMQDMEMGSRELDLDPGGPGLFEARGSALSMAGHWRADLRIAGAQGEEQTSFAFVVGQAPGANRPVLSPGRIVLLALNARLLLTLVALGGAAALYLRALDLRQRQARRQTGLLAAGLLALGLVLGSVTVVDAYQRSLPNPIPADAASLERGRQVYEANCVACHGEQGRGDGPAGLALRPRPADFRVHMAAGHTDQELFNWVSNGVEGTAMPAFRDTLSERERWDVINYIRTFAGQP